MIAIFMVSVLGMSALAVDVGNWYQQKQALQSAADSAALAASTELPVSWAAAQTAGAHEFTADGLGGDSVTYTQSSNLTSNDSVTVTASRTATSYFAHVFGISGPTLTVHAQATVESFTKVTSTGDVMPVGVMKGNYTLGTSYTIYGDGSSSNNGALSLDIQSGASCGAANGANDLANTISGSVDACPVTVGQTVDTKPGNQAGKIASGLNGRISTWKDFTDIVQVDGNGQYWLKDPSSPQLVIVPVVTNNSGGLTWPAGSSSVTVVGFAYFVITGCGSPSKQGTCSTPDGKYVNGTFVGMLDSNTAYTTGAWTSASNSAGTVELTS